MEGLGKALGGRAGGLSQYVLAGRLDSAVRASSAQFDDPDMLARLHVRLTNFGSSSTGAPAAHSLTTLTRSRACTCASTTSAAPRQVRLQPEPVLARLHPEDVLLLGFCRTLQRSPRLSHHGAQSACCQDGSLEAVCSVVKVILVCARQAGTCAACAWGATQFLLL